MLGNQYPRWLRDAPIFAFHQGNAKRRGHVNFAASLNEWRNPSRESVSILWKKNIGSIPPHELRFLDGAAINDRLACLVRIALYSMSKLRDLFANVRENDTEDVNTNFRRVLEFGARDLRCDWNSIFIVPVNMTLIAVAVVSVVYQRQLMGVGNIWECKDVNASNVTFSPVSRQVNAIGGRQRQ